jgi:hypothetical protein
MSAEFLARMADGKAISAVRVTVDEDEAFRYEIA